MCDRTVVVAAAGVSVALGLRLPNGVGWRDLTVVALSASSAFTLGLFFATRPVLTEAKVGALSTVGAALIAIAAARVLAAGSSKA